FAACVVPSCKTDLIPFRSTEQRAAYKKAEIMFGRGIQDTSERRRFELEGVIGDAFVSHAHGMNEHLRSEPMFFFPPQSLEFTFLQQSSKNEEKCDRQVPNAKPAIVVKHNSNPEEKKTRKRKNTSVSVSTRRKTPKENPKSKQPSPLKKKPRKKKKKLPPLIVPR